MYEHISFSYTLCLIYQCIHKTTIYWSSPVWVHYVFFWSDSYTIQTAYIYQAKYLLSFNRVHLQDCDIGFGLYPPCSLLVGGRLPVSAAAVFPLQSFDSCTEDTTSLTQKDSSLFFSTCKTKWRAEITAARKVSELINWRLWVGNPTCLSSDVVHVNFDLCY